MIRMGNMQNLMKNKLVLLGGIAVIVVAIVAGFLFMQNNKKSAEPIEEETVEEQALQLKAEDIGLKLTPNANNTEVTMEITDVSKFNSFDYEMSYDADVEGEIVPRGAIGSGKVESGESSITREITIGTCSSGKCKFDKGVTKISFIIRLNLKDGQTGIVKEELSLE